jgi:hypothetical protein
MRAGPKKPTLIVIHHRLKEATQIVGRQTALIEKLRAEGQPTIDAEVSLQIYISALELLARFHPGWSLLGFAGTGLFGSVTSHSGGAKK